MTDTIESTTAADGRPYHHGDLRHALIEAARAIVIRDGAQALSLRGVAREAGVSPAAPYHHFKDKQELVLAVGSAWERAHPGPRIAPGFDPFAAD